MIPDIQLPLWLPLDAIVFLLSVVCLVLIGMLTIPLWVRLAARIEVVVASYLRRQRR